MHAMQRLLLSSSFPAFAASWTFWNTWNQPIGSKAHHWNLHAAPTPPQEDTRVVGSAESLLKETSLLPRPKFMHEVLTDRREDHGRYGILLVGDVHGCYEELVHLHEAAMKENDGRDFEYVILVGDLCNKGPLSHSVIRLVQERGWKCVRGNHDDGAMRAALGDSEQQSKPTYRWLWSNENVGAKCVLSPEDMRWMLDIPYTLRIPKALFDDKHDTLIVHAGLIPGVPIEEQSIETMVTVREVVGDTESGYRYARAEDRNDPSIAPWAETWTGPEYVIFGHDAKRELQQCSMCTGIDTGACYGKKLTGMILPPRKLVQVQAKEAYSAIVRK